MAQEEKARLLIVEDDLDIADMLNAYFRVQGYDVMTVNWGEDGVRACQTNLPDLVILDIRLPDIDGFEVARRLRNNRRTHDTPIIFLTEKRERDDRLKGLEMHAEDYITKPFDIQELRLRVRNVLQSSRRSPLTNTITGLPNGELVNEQLAGAVKDADAALLIVNLGNISAFRELYGFVATDDLLRAVALMLQGALRDFASAEDFLGHLTEATFLISTHRDHIPALKINIPRQLEQSFSYFYSENDRETGISREKPITVKLSDIDIAREGLKDFSKLMRRLDAFKI